MIDDNEWIRLWHRRRDYPTIDVNRLTIAVLVCTAVLGVLL